MGADGDAPGVPRPPEETRPALEPGLSPEEFARWYWLKRELQAFAVRIGVSAAGSKQDLAARIARRLAGAGDPGDDARGAPGRGPRSTRCRTGR